MRRIRAFVGTGVAIVLIASGLSATEVFAPKASAANSDKDSSVLFGANWSNSKDIAFTGAGDSSGYHVYMARENEGFAWRTLASVQPGGVSTDSWTGYQCSTGTGRHVVVAVAPTHFVNYSALRDRGALAYDIDVATGQVRPLVTGVSLKYHTPGCGRGEEVVLSRSLGDDQQATELLTIDAETARVVSTRTVSGQVVSAVPGEMGVVAGVIGNSVVRFPANSSIPIEQAHVDGQPFDLVAAPDGLKFLEAKGLKSNVHDLASGNDQMVGVGNLASVSMYSGRGGRAYAMGASRSVKSSDVSMVKAIAGVQVSGTSMDGDLLIGETGLEGGVPKWVSGATHSAKRIDQSLSVGADEGTTSTELPGAVAVSPKSHTSQQRIQAVGANTTTPSCAVPRNVASRQVPQPSSQQAVWAVELSARNALTAQRPANYLNMSLPAYAPNGDFGRHALTNSPSTPAPPSVFEAIMAQESNWNQASFHALPGIAGNPNVADYYGALGGIDQIDYSQSDCGYGISQVTTNMRAADTGISANGKAKIAVDYAENVSAGLQILQDSWNQLQSLGITVNNNDPKYLENWYFAIWAYNTGIHTPADANGMYGLGWTNNPQNADYPPNRVGFLRLTYADAAHPGNWPYQERVMGWMETPQLDYNGKSKYSVPAYSLNAPMYNGRQILNVPAYSSFCDVSNSCSPTYVNSSNPSLSYCQLSGRNCYWHKPVTFAQCSSKCATSSFVNAMTTPEPSATNPHPPACNSSLPSSTVIVDDLPEPVLNVMGCTTRNWASRGTFTLGQGVNSAGVPISVIDTHQLGAGFGGHIYFSHNRLASDGSHLVTGTWTPPALAPQAYHVMVHLPSTGATSNSADYKITTSNGTAVDAVVDQHQQQDVWAGLGYYSLGANAKVTLNNVTSDSSQGVHDVGWDAIAFVPVSGTVVNHSFDAVSQFDFNQDLNTNTPWLANTPMRTMTTLHDWAIQYSHGSSSCWNNKNCGTYLGITSYPQCTGAPNVGCVQAATRAAANSWYNDAVAGGTSTTNHTASMSEAKWMGFDSPKPPQTITAATFAADDSYKIKTHVDTSFLVNNGTIVPGSQQANVTSRTGNTHIPTFVTGLINGISSDYGIAPPDLSFSAKDLNAYTNDATVSNPLATGYTPGRAYAPYTSPVSVVDNNQCVAVKAVSGGSIGWRPLVAEDSVRGNIQSWVAAVAAKRQANLLPQAVADTASELNSLFFAGGYAGLSGSIFQHAAPIWHQVNTKVCVNGSIVTSGGSGSGQLFSDLVEQSYMPDLYLYEDDHMINQAGAASNSPVKRGDFMDFSNSPATALNGNPYDACDFGGRGAGGNPWAITFTQDADIRPLVVHFCDEPTVGRDGQWSS